MSERAVADAPQHFSGGRRAPARLRMGATRALAPPPPPPLSRRRWLLLDKAARMLQRAWRSYSSKFAASKYRRARGYLALLVQTAWRGHAARKAAAEDREYFGEWAAVIQRQWRGWRARRRVAELRLHRPAVVIQAFWRGCAGRARADKLYLERAVTKIQTVVRRFLQQRRYRVRFAVESAAALLIQKAFHVWMAMKVRRVGARVVAPFVVSRARCRCARVLPGGGAHGRVLHSCPGSRAFSACPASPSPPPSLQARKQLLWERETAARLGWMSLLAAESAAATRRAEALVKVSGGFLRPQRREARH